MTSKHGVYWTEKPSVCSVANYVVNKLLFHMWTYFIYYFTITLDSERALPYFFFLKCNIKVLNKTNIIPALNDLLF